MAETKPTVAKKKRASKKKVIVRKKVSVTKATAAVVAKVPIKRRRRKSNKLTGGSSDHYKVKILRPTTARKPYVAECNDVIEALKMTYAEGNIVKAIWRRAADRLGNGKPGVTQEYDAEKVEFFVNRLKVQDS